MRKKLVEAVNARDTVAPVRDTSRVEFRAGYWCVQFLLMSMKVSLLYFAATDSGADCDNWLKFISDPSHACSYPVTPVHKTQHSYF